MIETEFKGDSPISSEAVFDTWLAAKVIRALEAYDARLSGRIAAIMNEVQPGRPEVSPSVNDDAEKATAPVQSRPSTCNRLQPDIPT